MKNLTESKYPDETVLSELFLAGIEPISTPLRNEKSDDFGNYYGKIGNWIFKRRWGYWSAFVQIKGSTFENNLDVINGIPLAVAMKLYNRQHPTKNINLGEVVRAGGDGNGLSPDEYVSSPIYNDDLDNQLVALGYKKEFDDLIKRDVVHINRGEIAKLFNEKKLIGERYVSQYHIDDLVGLKLFAETLNNYYETLDKVNSLVE